MAIRFDHIISVISIVITLIESDLINSALKLNIACRTVIVRRNETSTLGLSIKGGSEHSLPILISRIVSDSPADKSRELFVGDEILAVNDVEIDSNTTHDEALQLLRNSGTEVILRVRHHKAATILCKWWRKDNVIDIEKDNPLIKKTSRQSQHNVSKNKNVINGNGSQNTETNGKTESNGWRECVRMDLCWAYISRYVSYSDKLRDAGFEVRAINGQSVVVQCDNEEICRQWCATIINAINTLTDNHVIMFAFTFSSLNFITFYYSIIFA